MQRGFTLVELAIVLVIIGLLVGGVLVGQALIDNATLRGQMTQIQQYVLAAEAFRTKYGNLPGDLPGAPATQYGFAVGAGCNGQQGGRDSNGLIDGFTGTNFYSQGRGETALFWQDLTTASMIPGTYPNSGAATITCNACAVVAAANMGQIMPEARLGGGNFVYAYENSGHNWLGIGAPSGIIACGNMQVPQVAGMRVIDASNIDSKVDDGFPSTGSVRAQTVANATTVSVPYAAWNNTDPSNCFDGNPGVFPKGAYSVNAAAGDNSRSPNCGLSFRF